MQQIVVAGSNNEGTLAVWDLHTGTVLSSFKGNASPRNGLCRLGHDYLAAAQTNKDAVHFWTWHKDAVLQRSFVSEKITAMAATRDGVFLAGGGVLGNIYIWELSTGRLLTSWPAHYKEVSALAFLDGGGVLISAGADTVANVWLMAELVDATRDVGAHNRPQPMQSWAEHTLPITGLCCGYGEASALVATASLDRTLRLWSIMAGGAMRVLQLPSSLHAVAFDAGEHSIYAGAGDGTIFEVSLVSGAPVDLVAGSLAGNTEGFARLTGHTHTVTALEVSVEGELLVSGSDDGSVRVWELRSRQCLRVLPMAGKLPVSCLLLLQRPEYLAPVGQGGSQSGRQGPKRPQPLAPLAKFSGASTGLQPWEGPPVILDGSVPPCSVSEGLMRLAGEEPSVSGAGKDVEMAPVAPSAAEMQSRLAELGEQAQAAERSAQHWRGMYNDLQKFCIENALPGS